MDTENVRMYTVNNDVTTNLAFPKYKRTSTHTHKNTYLHWPHCVPIGKGGNLLKQVILPVVYI